MRFRMFIVMGGFLFIMGVIFYKFKKIEMLSGYDKNKKYDREGLAKFTGISFMIMGIIPIVSSIILSILNIDFGGIVEILIFIVEVVGLSINVVIKAPKYELIEEAEKDQMKKLNKTMSIGICILIAIILLPTMFLILSSYNAETKININNSGFEIKFGVSSYYNDLDAIKDIYVKNTIPKFYKISGYGIGNINMGNYKVDGFGQGNLFLDTNKGPYLYIITKDGFVIINNKDKGKTIKIYDELKRVKSW